MNTSKNNTETGKEVLFVDALHESLVANKIITNLRVIQCGTYYSRERGHFTYRVRCGNIKECPRCRTEELAKRRLEILSAQEECLREEGSIFMITGTLKHRKTDSLRFLQKKLGDSVKRLKNQYGWRQIMKSRIMSTKTVYETTYTLKSGYHPHTHMLIGLNQEGINKTQIHKALNNNWRNYTGANMDVTNIDSPTVYVGGKEEYPEKLLEIFRQQKREMQFNLKDKQFPRSRLETILMYYDQIPGYTNPSMPKEKVVKILKEMNRNQSYYFGR